MSRSAFFRQSGWMMIATVAGGAFMWSVHIILQKPVDQVDLGFLTQWLKRFVGNPMPKADYSLFNTFLPMLGLMGIPAIGLQTIFAQQTASVIKESHARQLTSSVRSVLLGVTIIWLMLVLGILMFQSQVLASLKIDDSLSLWLTLLAALPILWKPILGGVLQGQQNFLWYGWAAIMGGLGRSAAIAVIVRILGGNVGGAMLGVFVGELSATLIMLWQCRNVWRGASERFDWRRWLRRVIPLTLGLGASMFMLTADMIVIRWLFDENKSALYSGAGIIGRALVYFTVPMAAVMFPKIVQSAARSERTDVLSLALGATALAGGMAALFCTIFPGLPLQLVYDESYLAIKPLVPWFAWCMLPLTMSNVLINNLLARERFKAVPWLVGVALTYGATLTLSSKVLLAMDPFLAFKTVVQILGGFSLLLMGVSAWFSWQPSSSHGGHKS